MADTDALACTYAALLLSDAGVAATPEALSKAIAAAGLTVRPTLPILFARFLQTESVASLAAAAAAAAPTAAAAAAPAAAAGGAAAPAAAGGKKKEEPEEEDDDEMGFGLFD